MGVKAVQNGELRSISPSQIKTYATCPRKWWFEKIAGIRAPETPNLALGTLMHSQNEAWYEDGTIPEHPSCQKVVQLPEAPPRSADILIEEPRNYVMNLSLEGVPVKGRIDLIRPPDDNGQFLVVDWKSTKDWRYIKSPEELARDPQCAIYLKYGLTRWPEATSGLFMHGYMHTVLKKGGARASLADPKTPEEIEEAFDTLRKTVVLMKETAKAEVAEDALPNRSACGDFGGCYYMKQGLCPGSGGGGGGKGVLVDFDDNAAPQGDDMTLKERLAAKRAQVASINPPTEPAQTPEPDIFEKAEESVKKAEKERESNGGFDDVPIKTVQEEIIEEVTKAVENIVATKTEEPPVAEGGFTLYIGCKPDGEGCDDVANIIADHTPGILEHLRSKDRKAVPADAVDLREVAFGGGTSALVAFLQKNPPTGNVYSSNIGLSGIAAEVLKPLARRVVRAVS